MTPGREPLGGVFYLHGADEFTKELAARTLVERHLDPATSDFNFDRLRGKDLDVETLASVIATPPMMAEWRVILVREVEALAGSKKARTVLLDAMASPPPGMALILMATVPARSSARFYKDLARGARAREFTPLSADDVPGWIMERSQETHAVRFEADAARALAAGIGTNLGILDQEIAKLRELVGEVGVVRIADVERAGTRLPAQDRWRWFDLVGERRIREAVRTLPILLDQGETGVGLVIGLGTHLLRLGVLVTAGRAALEERLPRHQKWLARSLDRQARHWSADEITDAVSGLARVDQLLKASPLSDRHHLETWLLSLLQDEKLTGSAA